MANSKNNKQQKRLPQRMKSETCPVCGGFKVVWKVTCGEKSCVGQRISETIHRKVVARTEKPGVLVNPLAAGKTAPSRSKTQKFIVEVDFPSDVFQAKEQLEYFMAYGSPEAFVHCKEPTGVDCIKAIGFRVKRR